MKQTIYLLTISLVALLAACGDEANTTSVSSSKLSNADMEVDTYRELPSCAEKREGKTAYVVDQDQGYVCQKGKWIEDDEVVEPSSSSNEDIEIKSSSSVKSTSSGKDSDKKMNQVEIVDPSEVKSERSEKRNDD